MPRSHGLGAPLSAFEPPRPAQPGTGRRRTGLLARYPELPRIVLAGAIAGVALGFGTWYLGSSRGADQLDLEHFISLAAVIVLVASGLAALARAAMLSDVRVAFVLVAVLIGWNAGATLAFRVVPGNSTDGDVLLFNPSLLTIGNGPQPTPSEDTAQFDGPARCAWDPTHTTLLSVTSRRTFSAGDLPFPAQVTLVMATGTFTIERIDPVNGGTVATYAGSFVPSNASTSQVAMHNVVRTVNPSLDHATAVLVDLLPDLNGWTLLWDCPTFG